MNKWNNCINTEFGKAYVNNEGYYLITYRKIKIKNPNNSAKKINSIFIRYDYK